MRSPFRYTDSPYSTSPYSSSPGGMDFYFYGSTPVYEQTYDLDPASPFAMSEVMSDACSFPSSFTSSPHMIPPMNDFAPTYDHSTLATSIPSSASSICGSIYGGMSQTEEVPMPNYPLSQYDDSFSDSPSQPKYAPTAPTTPQNTQNILTTPSRPAKPFPCENSNCGKSFTRFADLKRHQSSVHNPVFRNCPVEHCSRKGSNGFPRRDHLVEHLRSYHHLDVPKKRVLKRSGKGAE